MKPESYSRQIFIVAIFFLFSLTLISYPAAGTDLRSELKKESGRIRKKEDELTVCLIILARAHEKKGDVESAIKYYQRLSRILKGDPEILEKLGDCYMRQEKGSEACNFFQAAYITCNQNYNRKSEIGKKWLEAFLSSQDKDTLKQSWLSWHKEYRLPDDEWGLSWIVSVFEKFNEWELALEVLDSALKDKPDSLVLLKQRVEILRRLGRTEDAISLCDSILSKGNESRERIDILTKLAGIIRNMDRNQQDKTLKSLGDKSFFSKAIFLHLTGKTEDAIRIMEGLEGDKNNLRNYILGFLYKHTAKYSQAIEAFEKYLTKEKDDSLRRILGQMYWEMGEKGKAISCWEKIDNLTDAGFIFKKYGETDQAVTFLEKKVQKDSNSFWDKMNYAYILDEVGRKKEGLETYISAFHNLWEGGTTYLNQLSENMYYTMNKNGGIEETEQFFLKILAKDPGDVWTRMALGLLYLRNGRIEPAKNQFETIVQDSKDKKATVFAMKKMAFCLFLQGKIDDAINAYEQLIRKGNLSNWQNAEIYLIMGLICQSQKKPDYKKAIEYYKKSLNVSPEAWTAEHAMYRTGQCHWLMGKEEHKKAITLFKSLLAKYKGPEYKTSVGIKVGLLEKSSPEEIDLYLKAEKLYLSGDWQSAVDIFQKLASFSGTGFAAEASLFELYHIYERILKDEEKASQIKTRLIENFPEGTLGAKLKEEEEKKEKASYFFNNFEIILCNDTEGSLFPLQTQNHFSQLSWVVFLFFKTENIFPQPEIVIEWYTPFNELYIRSKLSAEGKCWGIYVMDYLPGIITGPWHAKAFFDSIPVADIPFSIYIHIDYDIINTMKHQ